MNNNAQNITPGQRLRIFRESLKDEKGKKFTQQMFGEGIGYSRNWIGKWEQDLEEIPESAHEPLKRVYGLNPEWLETGEGEMFLKVVHKTFEDAGPEGGESFKAEKITIATEKLQKIVFRAMSRHNRMLRQELRQAVHDGNIQGLGEPDFLVRAFRFSGQAHNHVAVL